MNVIEQYVREKLTKQLPPTTCTPEMREDIVSIARRQGLSIGAVQRAAFQFFLDNHDSKTLNIES